MKIYLASPYTHELVKVQEFRFKMCNIIAGKLIRAGNIIFSPISHSHPIANACNLNSEAYRELWYKQDSSFLEWCDELYVLAIGGWEKSSGVLWEISEVAKMGKPINLINMYGHFI